MQASETERAAPMRELDVVIVGAGFGGLYMLYRARQMGLKARLFEAGDGVGGTWYWNRYPGARCDVPSFEYSYSFDPAIEEDWVWTERYAAQPEILAYIEHVARRHDLYRDITFNTRVTAAHYDQAACLWRVRTDAGGEVDCRFLVLAVGPLSVPNIPDFPGLDSFAGQTVHTGRWPKAGVDVAGKRVAVIGTGSSAIQVAPELAKEAERLYLVQRSPAYSVPSRNRPLAADEVAAMKADYPAIRARAQANRSALGLDVGKTSALAVDAAARDAIYEERWRQGGLGFTAAFSDLFEDVEANGTAADFVRRKILATVKDPALAQRLLPDTLIGCKRLCVDNGYFEMFNRDNVELVDLREAPLERVTPAGIVVGGREIALDVLVLATGFDAITGAHLRIDITGRDGRQLRDKWAEGPKTYLGLGIAGFPNMFMISGPGSPAGLANMVTSGEQNVDWIAGCIGDLDAQGVAEIEADPEAEQAWVEHVNAVADQSIYPLADSWYTGTNVPGKPRIFMPYLDFPAYRDRCADTARQGYAGFRLRRMAEAG